MPLKVEPTGKVFPVSDSSESIVRALKAAASDAGVVVRQGVRVSGIENRSRSGADGGFLIYVKGGECIVSDIVCVATGASREAHRWLEALGHEIVPPVPSLFTFNVRDKRLDGLQGLSVDDAEVQLVFPAKQEASISNEDDAATGNRAGRKKRKRRRGMSSPGLVQRGPLLITHWGVSGPAIIQLSSFGARLLHEHSYRAECVVNFMPSVPRAQKSEILRSAKLRLAQKEVGTVCPFRGEAALPIRLWRSLLDFAIGESKNKIRWAELSNSAVENIVDAMDCSRFAVTGKGAFKEYAQFFEYFSVPTFSSGLLAFNCYRSLRFCTNTKILLLCLT